MNKQLFFTALLICASLSSMEKSRGVITTREIWKTQLEELKNEWKETQSDYKIPFTQRLMSEDVVQIIRANPFWKKVMMLPSRNKEEFFEEICMKHALSCDFFPWVKARYIIAAGVYTSSVSKEQRERIRKIAQSACDTDASNLMSVTVG